MSLSWQQLRVHRCSSFTGRVGSYRCCGQPYERLHPLPGCTVPEQPWQSNWFIRHRSCMAMAGQVQACLTQHHMSGTFLMYCNARTEIYGPIALQAQKRCPPSPGSGMFAGLFRLLCQSSLRLISNHYETAGAWTRHCYPGDRASWFELLNLAVRFVKGKLKTAGTASSWQHTGGLIVLLTLRGKSSDFLWTIWRLGGCGSKLVEG